MTSPPKDTNAICEQDIRDEAVVESNAALVDDAQKLPDVAVSTIAESIPKLAIKEGTSWSHELARGIPARRIAYGALRRVSDGWRRTVWDAVTCKAHVDHVCPMAKTSYVYYDDEVYDSVLTEKTTGITYVTQLIFDSETKEYYVYYRWGETDYKLDGPFETIESAKEAFQVNYKGKFDVEWTERETTVSEKWTYEVQTYEPFEEIEEFKEDIEKTEVERIIARENELRARRKRNGAATKYAKLSTLEKVDDVWKRTVQILVTRKCHVDHVCPIAKTSYVHYDDEVYDSVLTEKNTGIIYVTQLIFNSETRVYYVYNRWEETDYELDGPYETLESAKEAFQVNYKEKFDVEWTERETTANEKWTYEVRTYETYEEIEELDEVVEDTEVELIIARENVLIAKRKRIRAVVKPAVSEKSRRAVTEAGAITVKAASGAGQAPETIKQSGEVVLEHVTEDIVVEETEKEIVITKEDVVVVEEDIVAKGEKKVVVEKKEEVAAERTKVAVEDKEDVATEETKDTTVEETKETIVEGTAKEIVITNETGKVAKPVVSEKSSWFRRAIGAGHAASCALHKVDGVWRRTVQVLTTTKAHVDRVCPIAKTSYVYYDDDDVYDSVLTERSTGIIYVTQLIFDSETLVYYVYYRWGETDYKLEGPHTTIESAKEAFQVTYKEKFDVEWKEREIATSGRWIYEIKTYETFEEIEEVEEVVEETEAEIIVAREKEIEVNNSKVTEETITIVATEEVTLEHVTKETVVVEQEEDHYEVVREITPCKETGVVAKPAVCEKSSWFRRALCGAEAAALGAGAGAVGAVAYNKEMFYVEEEMFYVEEEMFYVEEDDDPFVLQKKPLAGGKKGGSAGLSTTVIAAVAAALM